MSTHRWQRLARLAVVGVERGVMIGAGVSASADNKSLILNRPSDPVQAAVIEAVPLDVPGAADLPWAGGRVVVGSDPSEPGDEIIDRDRLEFPLFVRPPRPGDRFEPLGMGGRSMPLADFFRGAGVPRDQRASTPLVRDQRGIIWVVGHRIADRVKQTETTQQRLTLGWRPFPTA